MAKYCCCEHFYDLNEFVEGARVKFRELPVSMAKELALVIDDEFTIKRFLVKCNSLGDLFTVVELDQLPGKLFSPNVLTMKKVEAKPIDKLNDRTIMNLVGKVNDLTMENTALRHTLARGVRNNFDVE